MNYGRRGIDFPDLRAFIVQRMGERIVHTVKIVSAQLYFAPRVAQGNRAVEYRRAWFGIETVRDEISVPFELHSIFGLHFLERGLEPRADDRFRIRIQSLNKVGIASARMRIPEQAVVQPYLALERVACR